MPGSLEKIEYSKKFLRSFGKLSREIQDKAKVKEEIFKEDHFDIRLHTHKLHGKDSDKWSYSVDYDYRIKFTFLDNGRVLYLDIGTHDEIYQ